MGRVRAVFFIIGCIFILTGCGSFAKKQARSALAALNNGEVETYLQDWDENATFIYPGNTSASGEIKGKKAIRAWFANWRTVFPDLKFTISNIYLENNLYLGADNTLAVHWEAQGSNKFGKKVHSTGIGVVTITGSKITRVQDYIFDADKLRDFWGEE